MVGGEPLNPWVREEIKKAHAVLAVLSLNAFNSKWVRREIRHAQSLKKPVIPLLRPGVDVETLELLFKEKPIAIALGDRPTDVNDALPRILAALGQRWSAAAPA